MTTTWKARSFALVAAIGLVLAVGTVSAGAGISNTPVVNPTTVAAGETFTVSGGPDCIDSTLTIDVVTLGLSGDVDGSANWSIEFTAPADAEPGTYLVTVSGNECTFGDATVVITAAATTTTTAAPSTTTTTAAPAVAAVAAEAAPAFTG